MKKLIYSLAAVAVALGFSGCKETWDENPVFKGHEGQIQVDFLNEPAFKNLPIMLTEDTKMGNFQLTCSQPDFGYAAVATYRVQVSFSPDFTKFEEINEDFFTCSAINPLNKSVASAMEKLAGLEDESQLPLDYQPVYMRLRSFLAGSPDNSQFISNVVKFENIGADFWAVWKVGEQSGIFLPGGMNSWGFSPEWEFLSYKEENTWLLKQVKIEKDTQFKVANEGWGPLNMGAGGSNKISFDEEFLLSGGDNPGNLTVAEDFEGDILLSYKKGNYYILFAKGALKEEEE